MQLTVSKDIDRPPAAVWQFVAVDHVRNHPRWDPKMELRKLTAGPIGLGTRIHRRHTRVGAPIEGDMEVVEFQPERALGMLIRDRTADGVLEVRSRMTLKTSGDGRTTVTIELELPDTAPSMDPAMVEGSLARMKELIEAET